MEQRVTRVMTRADQEEYITPRREHAIENAAKHYSENHPRSKGDIILYLPSLLDIMLVFKRT